VIWHSPSSLAFEMGVWKDWQKALTLAEDKIKSLHHEHLNVICVHELKLALMNSLCLLGYMTVQMLGAY
jgi:hypothetical protein